MVLDRTVPNLTPQARLAGRQYLLILAASASEEHPSPRSHQWQLQSGWAPLHQVTLLEVGGRPVHLTPKRPHLHKKGSCNIHLEYLTGWDGDRSPSCSTVNKLRSALKKLSQLMNLRFKDSCNQLLLFFDSTFAIKTQPTRQKHSTHIPRTLQRLLLKPSPALSPTLDYPSPLADVSRSRCCQPAAQDWTPHAPHSARSRLNLPWPSMLLACQ